MAKAVLTPGEAVKAQVTAYNLSISQLAEGIKVSPSAARLLVNNKLRISASFAQRLSKYFGKTPEYWVGLQTAYELGVLAKDKTEAAVLKTVSKAVKAPAVKKGPAKKDAAKKPADKKAPAKRTAAKKVAVKKTPVKRAARKAASDPVNSASSYPSWTPPTN